MKIIVVIFIKCEFIIKKRYINKFSKNLKEKSPPEQIIPFKIYTTKIKYSQGQWNLIALIKHKYIILHSLG